MFHSFILHRGFLSLLEQSRLTADRLEMQAVLAAAIDVDSLDLATQRSSKESPLQIGGVGDGIKDR
jgi:hypothetical protein